MNQALRVGSIPAKRIAIPVASALMDNGHRAPMIVRHYISDDLAETPAWRATRGRADSIDEAEELAFLKPLNVPPLIEQALNLGGGDIH